MKKPKLQDEERYGLSVNQYLNTNKLKMDLLRK